METLSSKYININGSLLDLSVPCVMGILNITPDSFYAGSRMQTEAEITARAQQILDEGAGIIDIGAYSSRPNAENVSPHEEMERLRMGLEILRKTHPGALLILSGQMWHGCVWKNMEWQSSMILLPERWIRICFVQWLN